MIKKILSYFSLIILILFSFFYTEKTISIVKEKDPIMIELMEKKDEYKILNLEGLIENDTIIPGVNGCEVDINKSYQSLKKLGTFNSNLLTYKKINNKNSINKNYDKYIISGNEKEGYVSLIFKVKKDDNVENIIETLDKKNVKASFFVDGAFIENNIEMVNKMIKNYEVYPYGYESFFEEKDNIYTDSLMFRVKYDYNKLCLNENNNQNYLNYCSNNKISTIRPSIITNVNQLIIIKENLKKGSIISFNIDANTEKELNLIINYIFQKGFNIKYISELISEENKECLSRKK